MRQSNIAPPGNLRSDLPPGWIPCTLGELGHYRNGRGFKKAEWAESGRPIIRIQNLTGSGETFNYFTGETAPEHVVRDGDLLVSWAATLGVYFWRGPEAVLNQHIFRVDSFINRRFHALQIKGLIDDLYRRAHGSGMVHVTRREFDGTPLLLPPEAEQRRIVDEVEKQFTRLDAAVAGLQRVKANLKRYRASVLKAACEGRLVPTEAELARREGRSFESGEELLKRILKERRARWEADQLAKMKATGKVLTDSEWEARYREPEPVITDPVSKPKGWAVASLRQLAFVSSGNTPKGIEDAISASGPVPWFRVSDMNLPGNEYQMHRGTAFLTIESARALGLRLFGAGAVIFPKRGGAIATNKKRVLIMPSATDLNIMAADPVGCIRSWLHLWFRQLELGRLADGSNVPQINHGDVEPLPVPLPPLPEQERIVVESERRLSVVDELEATVEKNLARCARLRQSILKMAFEGRLVPQDPNDEPASVLLDRIRRERGPEEPRRRGVRRVPRP